MDLTPLGNQFVIKPSHGGGSEGVILGASSLDQILRARMEFPDRNIWFKSTVTPRTIQGRPPGSACFTLSAGPIPAGGIR